MINCDGDLYALIICNHPQSSGFTIFHLSSDQQQETSSVYTIDTTFKEIWPIKNQVDTGFGQITVTESVNTNYLAIGYGKKKKKKCHLFTL